MNIFQEAYQNKLSTVKRDDEKYLELEIAKTTDILLNSAENGKDSKSINVPYKLYTTDSRVVSGAEWKKPKWTRLGERYRNHFVDLGLWVSINPIYQWDGGEREYFKVHFKGWSDEN